MTLYLRSRRAPAALAVAVAGWAAVWAAWPLLSSERDVEGPVVVLTVLLLVCAASATLGSPDVGLDRTAALRWPWRRLAHVLVAGGVVVGLLALTLATGARFGPFGVVARDVAGLVGLAALGAAVLGGDRAWFLPLGWTLPVVAGAVPDAGRAEVGRVLTWQLQEGHDRASAVTAAVLALAGAAAYARLGPARRDDTGRAS